MSTNVLNLHSSEFALRISQQLRCTDASSQNLFCQKCGSCQLKYILQHFTPWFRNAGDSSRHAFLHGILSRLHDVPTMKDLNDILLSVCGKDSTYATSRHHPSFPGDHNRMTADKHIVPYEWDHLSEKVFEWFEASNQWMRRNFLLVLLSLCDYHLLRVACNFVQRNLNVEVRTRSANSRQSVAPPPAPVEKRGKTIKKDDKATALDYMAVDRMNFEFNPHAGDLLAYGNVTNGAPHSNAPSPFPLETSEDDLCEFSSSEEEIEVKRGKTQLPWNGKQAMDVRVDCVSSLSIKSYTLAGRKVDFIRYLPIQISKYILNLTDEKTLKRCSAVSRVWARVAGEVIKEGLVNQLLREGAMVTQGHATNAVNPYYAKDVEVPVPNLVKSGSHRILYLSSVPSERKTTETMMPPMMDPVRLLGAELVNEELSSKKDVSDLGNLDVQINMNELTSASGTRSRKVSRMSTGKPPTPLSLSSAGKRSRKVSKAESHQSSLGVDSGSVIRPNSRDLMEQNIPEEQENEEDDIQVSQPRRGVTPKAETMDVNKEKTSDMKDSHQNPTDGAGEVPDSAAPKEPLYKGDCTMEAAYVNVSTRKVIMEERNVYCGPYSVLVLLDGPPTNRPDPTRVLHYAGGDLVVIGNGERIMRLIDVDNRETAPRLRIRGHAGSIRSVYLSEIGGYILSGSYDTSVRRWDIKTGQCLKIYRGHMGSVNSLAVHRSHFVSGSVDSTARLWHMDNKHSLVTLKHRHPVTAVEIGEVLLISGDQSGRVKVWECSNGKFIKSLHGHNEEVTCIKSDRYHIFSGSKDGFVLMWSAIGYFNTCLRAFRHPKTVLNISYQYMRIISGCEDGRIRVWNVLNGKCCRIMRGNSRSDPILHLIPIGNRMILNTATNVLIFNFEPIDYRYDLLDDSIPNLLPYKNYSDAPIRKLPHSIVRAQRSLYRPHLSFSDQIRTSPLDPREETLNFDISPERLRQERGRPFTASNSLKKSRLISASKRCSSAKSKLNGDHSEINIASSYNQSTFPESQLSSHAAQCGASSKSLLNSMSMKSPADTDLPSQATFPLEFPSTNELSIRRASYGFEGIVHTGSPADLISLQEMKTFLKSQLRAPMEETRSSQPPFIKFTAEVIRQGTANKTRMNTGQSFNFKSPPYIGKRKATSLISANQTDDDVEPASFYSPVSRSDKDETGSTDAITGENRLPKYGIFEETRYGLDPVFGVVTKPLNTNHIPKETPLTMPQPNRIRPKTATTEIYRTPVKELPSKGSETVTHLKRPTSAATTSALPRRNRPLSCGSSASRRVPSEMSDLFEEREENAIFIPIKFYPTDLLDKMREKKRQLDIRLKQVPAQPINFHHQRSLCLRTQEQEAQYMTSIEQTYAKQAQQVLEEAEKSRLKLWKKKASIPR